jgi:hypothetical protein
MRVTSIVLLGIWLILSPIQARVHDYANQGRVSVGNRSANVNQNFNRNTNVNRNVNVNNNVNVNRNVNVNVHRGYYGGGCCAYHDDWNWGSFAAGAVVGVATTAVVAAATSSHNTTVVAAPVPAMGTIVGALPGGCTVISAPGTAIYNCNSIYYRPYYQGSSLVYQIVTYP